MCTAFGKFTGFTVLVARKNTADAGRPQTTMVYVHYMPNTILNLGTGWSFLLSIGPVPLYFRGKGLWYPLNRKLCGPQSCLDVLEKCFPLPGPELWTVIAVAWQQHLLRYSDSPHTWK